MNKIVVIFSITSKRKMYSVTPGYAYLKELSPRLLVLSLTLPFYHYNMTKNTLKFRGIFRDISALKVAQDELSIIRS